MHIVKKNVIVEWLLVKKQALKAGLGGNGLAGFISEKVTVFKPILKSPLGIQPELVKSVYFDNAGGTYVYNNAYVFAKVNALDERPI